MWEIVRAGGPVMWPILLCSVVAVAIAVERSWSLQTDRVLPAGLLDKVWQMVQANQVTSEVIEALQRNSPLGRVLAAGLKSRHQSRDQMMERLEDTGRHVVHELERFLNTLGTVAAIAPLLGLLGTVTGIMNAFSAINEGAIGDPKMLSGGISEALITTAAGLLVAIPALVAYRYLRGRVDGLVVEMEKQAIALADAVETAGPRPPVRGRGKSAA